MNLEPDARLSLLAFCACLCVRTNGGKSLLSRLFLFSELRYPYTRVHAVYVRASGGHGVLLSRSFRSEKEKQITGGSPASPSRTSA